MSRLQRLTDKPAEFDQIKALEAEREPFKVTVALSPRAEFLVQNIHETLKSRSHTATVREVLEAALLDWLEAKGYKEDSEEFRAKYLGWLQEHHLGPEEQFDIDPDTGEEQTGRFWNFHKVAL